MATETHDRQGFRRHPPQDGGAHLSADPAARRAFRISIEALFPAHFDVVACGVTSAERRKAPKLSETLWS